MSERHLPFVFDLPDPPPSVTDPAIRQWMLHQNVAIQSALQQIARRMNAILLVGTAAEQPVADGTQRFYWKTDTKILEFDDGAWNAV